MTVISKDYILKIAEMDKCEDVTLKTLTDSDGLTVLAIEDDSNAEIWLDKAGTEALIAFAQDHLEKLS